MMKRFSKGLGTLFSNKNNWLSFVAGLSLVFAYSPFGLWWLPFVALTLWLALVDKCDNPIPLTYLFALGWFSAGIHWVHISIADFGGMPLIVSLLLMLLLCLYLAIYPTLCVWLTKKLSLLFHFKRLNLWLLPSIWLLTEYLRANVLTGFPWLSLGYSQINGPLSSLAPIIGEVGISFVMLLTCVATVNLLPVITNQKINKKSANTIKLSAVSLMFIGLLVVTSAYQQWVIPTGKTVKTALVQGNIAQELKWLPEKEWPTLARYLELTEQQKNIDIFVWPESAIPAIEPAVQEYLRIVDKALHKQNAALITGIINYDYDNKAFYNSLITLGNKHNLAEQGHYIYGHDNRFSKHHLLPIGEFVPFAELLRPLAPLFNLPMSSFSRGSYVQPNLMAKDIHILPLICFEIAFAEQLLANFTPETQLLLTVSNDAWFADSIGPHQHMEIARMRALEMARPLVRTTNTGITAAVDEHGRMVEQLPQFHEGVLISELRLVTGFTPYSTYGNNIIYIIALLLMLMPLLANYRKTNT